MKETSAHRQRETRSTIEAVDGYVVLLDEVSVFAARRGLFPILRLRIQVYVEAEPISTATIAGGPPRYKTDQLAIIIRSAKIAL